MSTWTILLVWSLIELHHCKLRLVEGGVHSNLVVVDVLYLNDRSMATFFSVGEHLRHSKDALAEVALADWVRAFDGLVANLILLEDTCATAFAANVHKVAIVELVGAQKQLVVGQLVETLLVVALESDLVEVLLLEFV